MLEQRLAVGRVQALREESRQRLLQLVSRTAQWVRQGQASEVAAIRWTDWIEPLLRRESYLALLLERPQVHERLLRVLKNDVQRLDRLAVPPPLTTTAPASPGRLITCT